MSKNFLLTTTESKKMKTRDVNDKVKTLFPSKKAFGILFHFFLSSIKSFFVMILSRKSVPTSVSIDQASISVR